MKKVLVFILVSAYILLLAGCDMLPTFSSPPAVSVSETSRGFYLQVQSTEEYSIEASAASAFDWKEITSSAVRIWNEGQVDIYEYIWSDWDDFPVPTELDIRVVTDSSGVAFDSVTPEFLDMGYVYYSTAITESEVRVFIDQSISPEVIPEIWVKVRLGALGTYILPSRNT